MLYFDVPLAAGSFAARVMHQDTPLGAYTLPAGCAVLIPISVVQRQPEHWPDPETFDPQRFGQSEAHHPQVSMQVAALLRHAAVLNRLLCNDLQ